MFFLIVLFFILAVFVYFKYIRVRPKETAETKKSQKPQFVAGTTVNPLIESLFTGETSQEYIALKNLTNYYIDKYIENSLDALTINALNTKYWELVLYIINRKFKTGTENLLDIAFSEDEKKIIDFAYLSNNLIMSGGTFNENSLDESLRSDNFIKDHDFKFYTITSWLSDSLNEFTSSYAIERLQLEFENLVSKISIASQEKEISLKTRKLLLYEISKQNAGKPFLKALMATSEKIDRIIDAYSFYKYKTESGFSMTKTELLEFVNIENFLINSLRNERREELKSIAYGERYNNELVSLETEIINKECLLLSLVSLKARCMAEINKSVKCQKEANANSNIEFLQSKVEYLKSTLGVVAKRNEIEPILFMTKKNYKKIPDTVFKIIAKFIEADPQVFRSKTTKSAGLPDILFVPGCGNGIYNVETNTLILPEFPIKDYNELVISALALYRWETDDEGNLKRSFHSLKCNKRLSFASLQQAFIKDFVLFVTREKDGGGGLDKEILDWFKFEIAPKKGEEIRIDVRPRPVSKEAKEAREMQEAPKAETKDADAVAIDDASQQTLPEPVEAGPVSAAGEVPVEEIKAPADESVKELQPASAEISADVKPVAPSVSEDQLKKELVLDKLKLLLKNNELDENRVAVNFTDEKHNFNIEFKNLSVNEFEELVRMVYDNPKLREYLIDLYKKNIK
jgi:hypothetical protein